MVSPPRVNDVEDHGHHGQGMQPPLPLQLRSALLHVAAGGITQHAVPGFPQVASSLQEFVQNLLPPPSSQQSDPDAQVVVLQPCHSTPSSGPQA
jgi:hypothetical protein